MSNTYTIQTSSNEMNKTLTELLEIINFYDNPKMPNNIQKEFYLTTKNEIEKILEKINNLL